MMKPAPGRTVPRGQSPTAMRWGGFLLPALIAAALGGPANGEQAAQKRPTGMVVYNDDGWSSYMRYPAPMSPEDIERFTVGSAAGSGTKVYQFCALGGHAVNYQSAFLPRVGDTLSWIRSHNAVEPQPK